MHRVRTWKEVIRTQQWSFAAAVNEDASCNVPNKSEARIKQNDSEWKNIQCSSERRFSRAITPTRKEQWERKQQCGFSLHHLSLVHRLWAQQRQQMVRALSRRDLALRKCKQPFAATVDTKYSRPGATGDEWIRWRTNRYIYSYGKLILDSRQLHSDHTDHTNASHTRRSAEQIFCQHLSKPKSSLHFHVFSQNVPASSLDWMCLISNWSKSVRADFTFAKRAWTPFVSNHRKKKETQAVFSSFPSAACWHTQTKTNVGGSRKRKKK